MGCPFSHIYLSKSKDNEYLFLSGDYKPVLTDEGLLEYPETFRGKDGKMWVPMGHDIYIPNVMGWEGAHEPVEVIAIRSETETGIWCACIDDYFGGEHWLHTVKPEYRDGGKRGCNIDDSEDELNSGFGLYIGYKSLQMEVGEGPIPVTFQVVNNKMDYNEGETK